MQLPAVAGDDDTPYQPLQILTSALPPAKAARAYSALLQATRAATWRVTAGMLPMGLTLSPSGLITGTPSSSGQWSVEVTAAEDAGFTSHVLTLVVSR
jgi:hypothetical protein